MRFEEALGELRNGRAVYSLSVEDVLANDWEEVEG